MTHLAAGPWCTMVLADLGADVVKVERPEGGDMSRQAGSVYCGGESAVFLALNRNKRSLALDLKRPESRDVLQRLVGKADILVENLRPGKTAELGVGYDAVAAMNPRIVYASISAFGQTGPYVDMPGNDPIIQAMSGAMSITGEADGPPARQGVSVPDFGAGMMTAFAILAAIVGRERSGRGAHLDLNLLDVAIFALGPRAQEYLINRQEQPRVGSAHPRFAPYQAYRCKGGRYLYIAAINDKFWHKLCLAIGRPELADHPDFATNVERTKRREDLVALLEPILLERERDAWLAEMRAHGVPCGPVNELGEALSDPQVIHNELIHRMHHPMAGDVDTIGLPVRVDGSSMPVRAAPPLLGEHTVEVLAECGLSSESTKRLLRAGVVAARPGNAAHPGQ
jgi:crotonobetainyl-CoA:carnitine CoA-transferase CaiB-like acyl-CoA transferase